MYLWVCIWFMCMVCGMYVVCVECLCVYVIRVWYVCMQCVCAVFIYAYVCGVCLW